MLDWNVTTPIADEEEEDWAVMTRGERLASLRGLDRHGRNGGAPKNGQEGDANASLALHSVTGATQNGSSDKTMVMSKVDIIPRDAEILDTDSSFGMLSESSTLSVPKP